MTITLNLVIILLVLLIAYWWANQGLFSALLHLACVVAAGAIAFAFWEPLTMGLLMRGKAFDDYAWGVSLVGLFCISLVTLRIAMDKLAPGNVNIPMWANFVFGMPVGIASGVLTVGILFIGAGFLQSHQQIMGYSGYGRSARTAQVGHLGAQLWAPVHKWTTDFYEFTSNGSLYPHFNNTPMAQYNPQVYKQASLLRDSFGSGRGKLSLLPSAAKVVNIEVDPQTNRYAVEMEFGTLARDFGQQLTLSASQVRLICTTPGSSRSPVIVHPTAWRQETEDQPRQRFMFDNVTHYITSIPGRESLQVSLEFDVPSTAPPPRFIQVRGTRFLLPRAEEVEPGTLGTSGGARADRTPVTPGSAPAIDNLIRVSNDLRPFMASSNQLSGTMRHNDRFLTEGVMTRQSGGDRPTRALMIRGVEEPPGTRVVQLDVSRGTAADIFGPIRTQVGENATLALVDRDGNTYSPIGFIHEHRDGTTVHLEPARLMRTADQFPVLPTSGTDKLRLLFRVTINSTVVAFQYGDVTVGRCQVLVEAGGRR